MRILLLTQVVPYPPDSGPKIKTYNVLRFLAGHHDVHLVSYTRTPEEEAHARALSPLCAGVTTVPLKRSRLRDAGYFLRSLATGNPFLVERDDRREMRQMLLRVVEEFRPDAVHADQLTMAQFALRLVANIRVLDEHNAVWTIVQRLAARQGRSWRRLPAELEWRKLRAYEGNVARKFDWVTVVSEDDRLALEQAARGSIRSACIPIAVDTAALTVVPRTSEARHVLSVATMFYPPNVEGVHWFATAVFPAIRRAVPATEFAIVGNRPPALIRRLEGADTGIVVSGYVADLEPLLARSAVLVVPVHSGSGMRVKILEAFARGIPVVSTTVGVEGIDARPGEHLLVADDPTEFARAVVRVLEEPPLARRLAAAARSLVEARYDWRTALTGLHELYPPGPPRASRSGDAVERGPWQASRETTTLPAGSSLS